ncbi:Ero1-like protein [Geodia barretti]|uniref:Ero1-like protein n=1 Tax=Geodia barretti TaxID=519541 RepID=A0AA35RW93_GEOBA|nr:Ero1-like protein [Geodia barretti]
MRFVYNNLLLVWASLGVAYDPFNEAVQRDRSLRRVDQCFCELQGPVDVCCCDVETVDTLNSEKIYPLISSLVEFPFFKFYQVNLNQPCPFWPDDSTCMTKLCDVQECEETEIPVTLKLCDQEQEENLRLSYVNSTVSTQQQEDFMKWEKHDDSEESFCESDVDSADGMIYVDLLLNPERFTGYSGASAHRLWNSIYKENCFRPEIHSSVMLPFESSLVQGMCLEKRAFFRILSGMHSSINIHLSALYRVSGKSTSSPEFGPNLNEFVRRFDTATTNGQELLQRWKYTGSVITFTLETAKMMQLFTIKSYKLLGLPKIARIVCLMKLCYLQAIHLTN